MQGRKLVRGRRLKNFSIKKGGNQIPVSFPQDKLHVLVALNKLVESGCIKNTSRSQIMVGATETVVGNVNTSIIEERILNLYKTGELTGPVQYEFFNDVLAWELRAKNMQDILEIWSINNTQMAFILYRYMVNFQ